MIDYKTYNIDFSRFNLLPEQFDHQSTLHGTMHTYRVMIHCLRLGILTGKKKEALISFFGAYIHDMARLHDGYCTKHGADSSKYKLPLYQSLFRQCGAKDQDIKTIQQIVTWHSLPNEPAKDHPVWETLALIKDSDALDRIRLGAHDLNPNYLRYEETHKCIAFGEELFYHTVDSKAIDFNDIIQISTSIERQ